MLVTVQDRHQRPPSGLRHARTRGKGFRRRGCPAIPATHRIEPTKRLSSGAVRPHGRLTFDGRPPTRRQTGHDQQRVRVKKSFAINRRHKKPSKILGFLESKRLAKHAVQ